MIFSVDLFEQTLKLLVTFVIFRKACPLCPR